MRVTTVDDFMRKNDMQRRKTDMQRSENWIFSIFGAYLGPGWAESSWVWEKKYGQLMRVTTVDDFMRKNDMQRRKNDMQRSKNLFFEVNNKNLIYSLYYLLKKQVFALLHVVFSSLHVVFSLEIIH